MRIRHSPVKHFERVRAPDADVLNPNARVADANITGTGRGARPRAAFALQFSHAPA